MTDTIDGVIASANDKGVKLEGEQDWRNFTKQEWRKEPWDTPNRGDSVKLALNNGFVYAIKRVSAGTNGASPMSATRDEHIARAVALKAAVKFAGTQAMGEQTASDVVMNAEFFLTFLEASEPQDSDPGPEVPFE